MNKIIKIDEEFVCVGNDKKEFQEISKDCFAFEPKLGDLVSIYTNGEKIIVVKEEGTIVNKIEKECKCGREQVKEVFNKEFIGDIKVDKFGYVLLAFFLGSFGLHKFFAGKVGLGCLYLLFCWTYIPTFISIIEAIIACTQKPDIYGRIMV